MITIILPGYSPHNKIWAEDVAKELKSNSNVIVHSWRHWENQSLSLSLSYEIDQIIKELGKEKVDIIAKSVGVYVALNLIPKIAEQVNKVIFCGIASVAREDRKEFVAALTSKVPVENILCIQNENDKFVKFADAEKFYHSVEPKLEVISKPRSDHDYPFTEDFRNFLQNRKN